MFNGKQGEVKADCIFYNATHLMYKSTNIYYLFCTKSNLNDP